MPHEDEYHDNMVRLLELIWGDGYMAPGGAGNVANLLSGLDTAGKRILDIGCGVGGPAAEMASQYDAEVVGIDLEAPLVARAIARAQQHGLESRCSFQTVKAGTLPFDDHEFDIIVSSGAITQTSDKPAIFADILRVVKPGGWFSCYEWMKSDAEYSDDMHYWFKLEGLTYAMCTLEEHGTLLQQAGFDDISLRDATPWYQREARREYERIKGPLYAQVVDALGRADADHFVENWRAMVVVIDNGEMRQGYCRARKPD